MSGCQGKIQLAYKNIAEKAHYRCIRNIRSLIRTDTVDNMLFLTKENQGEAQCLFSHRALDKFCNGIVTLCVNEFTLCEERQFGAYAYTRAM